MSVATASVGSYVVGYTVSLTLSQGTLLLSTIPRYGGNETFNNLIMSVPPVAYDHEGMTRFGYTLEQNGPYRIGNFSHQTLNDLLKANPLLNRVVSISAVIDTGEAETISVLCSGKIARIVGVTPTSVSFEAEQRTKLVQTFIPMRKIDKTLGLTTEQKKRIPPESDGEAMPVSFGRFLPYVPPLFSAVTPNRIQQVMNLWYAPVLARMVPIQSAASNGADRSIYAYAEYVNLPRHVSVNTFSDNPNLDAYLYLSAIGSFGRVWKNDPSDGFTKLANPFATIAYAAEVGKQPYVKAGITASKYVPTESTGTITNPEFAIDRRMENYCVLGVGARACWEVRIATGIGRLSMNTADNGTGDPDQNWEGTNRPSGIASAALLCFPDNNFVPTSGVVHIALKYPGATTATAFGISDYTPLQLATAGMQIGGVAPILRYCSVAAADGRTGEFDDGWAGTKWERGDFSAGGSDDGPDRPIFLSTQRDTRPMRVAIHNETNKTLAINTAGMECGFKLADDRDNFAAQRQKGAKRDKSWWEKGGLSWHDLNLITAATKWSQK